MSVLPSYSLYPYIFPADPGFPAHGTLLHKMMKRNGEKRRWKGLAPSRRVRYRKNRAGDKA